MCVIFAGLNAKCQFSESCLTGTDKWWNNPRKLLDTIRENRDRNTPETSRLHMQFASLLMFAVIILQIS
jgi:hypothetical protein